jgi:hypothetical protein
MTATVVAPPTGLPATAATPAVSMTSPRSPPVVFTMAPAATQAPGGRLDGDGGGAGGLLDGGGAGGLLYGGGAGGLLDGGAHGRLGSEYAIQRRGRWVSNRWKLYCWQSRSRDDDLADAMAGSSSELFAHLH